jgi:hypothetical protein
MCYRYTFDLSFCSFNFGLVANVRNWWRLIEVNADNLFGGFMECTILGLDVGTRVALWVVLFYFRVYIFIYV